MAGDTSECPDGETFCAVNDGTAVAAETEHKGGSMSTKLKAVPVSRAKTAWGLCADVIRAVMKEPKRVNMNVFVLRVAPEDGGPACGTVGCFAGWVALFGAPQLDRELLSVNAADEAVRLLGNNIKYWTVGPEGRWVFNSGVGDACEHTNPGTKAHARAVVTRIRKFMLVNEKALRARKLADAR